MAISINRYVDITSGLGAGAVATTRNLVGRFFTGNSLVPPGTYLRFSSASAVGDYFGTSSEEYLRAVFYFSWISKNTTRPQSIQFARWVDVATEAKIYGMVNTDRVLGQWTSITNGSIGLTIGGVANTFTAIDFSTALSFTDIASLLQTKIQTAVGTQWTAATVTYSNGAFNFVSGDDVAAEISVQEGVGGTPIAGSAFLGWIPEAVNNGQGVLTPAPFTDAAIWANGSAVETITDMLDGSANESNDFGSFAFLTNLALTLDEVVEAAEWNQDQNVMYLYSVPVSVANASAWHTALESIGGVALTLSNTAGEYPEQMPMMIEAATDYTAVNSVQNYMFQIFSGITPSVTADASADAYDAASINYYGTTQTSGQLISFYQRGLLQGSASPTNITDMNAYVNEIWLKDAAAVAILNLLLGLAQISANQQGRGQILSVLQTVIDLALLNGTISVGKTLTSAQKAFITNQTADNKAWYQVQTSGYWVDCVIEPIPNIDPVQYQANYMLIYSKDDVIRKVVGTQTLI